MNALLEKELEDLEDIIERKEDIEESEGGRFKIKDLDSANWAFRKLKAIDEKKKEVIELANKEVEPYRNEIERILTWKEDEIKQYGKTIEFFNFLLEEYYRGQKELDPKFKLSTPYGKVTSRKQQDKWTYDDGLILESLKENKLDKFIRIKEEVEKADLKKEATVLEYENGYIAVCNGEVLGKVAPNDEDGIEYVNVETGEVYNTQENFYDIFEQVVICGGKIINGLKVEQQPESISVKVVE